MASESASFVVDRNDAPSAAGEFARALSAARDGSQPDLGGILEIYRPYLLAVANREFPSILEGKQARSDLVQDAILKGLEHFETFQGTTSREFRGWLRRILLNLLANAHKSFACQSRHVAREQTVETVTLPADQPTPSDQLRQREKRERIQVALARLPERYRTVIQLRHFDDLPFREIGSVMNLAEDAARKLWLRGVERLQQELRLEDSKMD